MKDQPIQLQQLSMKKLYKDILNSVERAHDQNIDRKRNDRVLIIDGLNTFIRCWSSIPTMNDDGDHVAGVTGVLKSIGYAIRNTQPTRVIVVFDGKGGSQKRKKRFSGYKSERSKNKLRVNRQYADLMNEEDEKESMKRQYTFNIQQTESQFLSRRNDLQSNINEAYNAIPSLGQTLLNIGTQGAGMYFNALV